MRRAGRRDRYIEIQRTINTSDGIGGTVESWATLANFWAEVVPIKAKEKLQSDREIVAKQNRFIIDYSSTITEKDRIVYNSKYWDIESLRELGRGDGLEILARVVD